MALFKKACAEFIGTFVLVFVACGVAAYTGGSAKLVATSLAFGLVIVAMAYSIGRVSGCHVNPAVSLGCLMDKRMSVKEFFVYIVAQILGGLLGAIAMFGVFHMAGITLAGNACNTATELTAGGIISALLTEIILTGIFVYVILNVTDEKSGNSKLAGIVIGLTLTLVHLIGINITGTSVNPARSIATAFGDLIFNGNTAALAQVWMFIVAPLVGAVVAALIYKGLNKEKAEKKEALETKTKKTK